MFYKLFSSSPQFTKRPETSGSGFDIIDVIMKFQSPKSIPSHLPYKMFSLFCYHTYESEYQIHELSTHNTLLNKCLI